ncbi:MAG: hypothetical protein ACK58T_23830, partial [Phycisphaerae bacterium]
RLLKQWHFADLPDNMEMARNEYIFDEQNNRNAFVDSVQYPCFIRFSNMTKWTPQVLVSGTELSALDEAVSYQWFLNGEPITGATASTYTAEVTGNYSVAVQQLEACPAITGVQQLIDVSVAERESHPMELSAFPTPASGPFRLRLAALTPGHAS